MRLAPLQWLSVLGLALVAAMAVGAGRSAWQPGGEPAGTPASTTAGGDPASPRFVGFDVLIDPHGRALGAYQVEIVALEGVVATLVGVEGGDGAYGHAPYYDPAALHGGAVERVVVAGIASVEQGENSCGPGGEVRVARLHYMVEGDAEAWAAWLRVTLIVAGVDERTPIDAGVRLVEVEGGT